jgi:glycerol-3-phosphate dehydrogenase subunit C
MVKGAKKVAYFAGCMANYIEPDIGKAIIHVLQANSYLPIFPDQKCCANPKRVYGDVDGFMKNAAFNVYSLSETDCDIVSDCTSCVRTIKCEYPDLLKGQEAEDVSRRTYDIMEYLGMLRARNMLNTVFQPINLRILYHSPCHLRVFGNELVEGRVKLMKLIPGITVTLLDGGCCGMGGTFGFKSGNYEMSMAIGRPLFEEILRLSPDMVVTECPTCRMQIEQGTGIKVIHPVIILKQAYGF